MGIAALVPLIGPALQKVLSFIPDPEQKAKAEAAAMNAIMDQEDSFRDFVLQYEGAGKDVHWLLQLYRGSVRPTITYAAFAALMWSIWTNQPVAIVTMVFNINLVCMVFWFGSKSLERLGLDLGKIGKKDDS